MSPELIKKRKLSGNEVKKKSFSNDSQDASKSAGSAEADSKSPQEFHDSTAFLKGTQSLNPHNDYSQNFVDTEQRPQNFIR